MRFQEYLAESGPEKINEKLIGLLYILENESMINESEEDLQEGIKEWLGAVGLKVHKGDGVIDYLKQFSQGAGKLILAAIKGDSEEVKKIANSLDKAKVIDFLLKLDMMSMHIVTGPIHFIDALTGWDLAANLKHAVKQVPNLLKDIWTSLNNIKMNISDVVQGKHQQKILQNVNRIAKSLPAV